MSTATTTPTRYEQYAARVLARGYDALRDEIDYPIAQRYAIDFWRFFFGSGDDEQDGLPATLRGTYPEPTLCEACGGSGKLRRSPANLPTDAELARAIRRASSFGQSMRIAADALTELQGPACPSCRGQCAVDPLDAIARELADNADSVSRLLGVEFTRFDSATLRISWRGVTPTQLALRLWRAGLTARLTADDVNQLEGASGGHTLVRALSRDRRVYGIAGRWATGAMMALCETDCEACRDSYGNRWTKACPACHGGGRVPLVALAEHRDWTRDDDGNALDGRWPWPEGESFHRDYDPGDGTLWEESDLTPDEGVTPLYSWERSGFLLGRTAPETYRGPQRISAWREIERRAAAQCNYTGAPGNPEARLPAGKLVLACSGRSVPRANHATPTE